MRVYRRAVLLVLPLAVVFSLTVALHATGEPGSEMGDAKGAGGAAVKRVARGIWGGEHIRLEVGEEGARVEYDCAHGTVESPLVVDRRGRFDVKGTYVEERGGPVRQGETQNTYAVRLSGRVSGTRMRLTVRRSDDRSLIGAFTLEHGREPSLVKCR